MDDATWRRHANPWSGWTRFAIMPAMALAIWSRIWLGWGAAFPVAFVIGWVWLNPRAFPPPDDFGAWMSRGVQGERIWLERAHHPIPVHHVRAAWFTTVVAVSGLPFLAWGLWSLNIYATLLGLTLSVGGKMWFVDRMVWLHADITGTSPGTPLADPTFAKD